MTEEKIYHCCICGKAFRRATDKNLDFFPFCSERCRLQDLGNWLREEYVTSRPVSAEEQLALLEKENGGENL